MIQPLTPPPGAYLVVYRDTAFAPPFTYISQPYDDLSQIGWNDMISSFKELTTVSGYFATDSRGQGAIYSFCCGTSVTYVGDYYNDKFSSVYP